MLKSTTFPMHWLPAPDVEVKWQRLMVQNVYNTAQRGCTCPKKQRQQAQAAIGCGDNGTCRCAHYSQLCTHPDDALPAQPSSRCTSAHTGRQHTTHVHVQGYSCQCYYTVEFKGCHNSQTDYGWSSCKTGRGCNHLAGHGNVPSTLISSPGDTLDRAPGGNCCHTSSALASECSDAFY